MMKKTVLKKLLSVLMLSALLMSNYKLPANSLTQDEIFQNEKIALAAKEDPKEEEPEDPPIFIPNSMDSLNFRYKQIMDSVMYLEEDIPNHLLSI